MFYLSARIHHSLFAYSRFPPKKSQIGAGGDTPMAINADLSKGQISVCKVHPHTRTHVHMYTHTRIHTYTRTHFHTYTHASREPTYAPTHPRADAHTDTHIYYLLDSGSCSSYTRVCIQHRAHAHIHTRTHTNTHTLIHTRRRTRALNESCDPDM